jgi:hypothetical protein
MKRLLITLLLISPFSFADWGDVYYCQMTSNSTVTLEGQESDYTLEKFTFKLDRTKNAMVFGKGGPFDNYEMELVRMIIDPSDEKWRARDTVGHLNFTGGKLLYAMVGIENINTISANCDKF